MDDQTVLNILWCNDQKDLHAWLKKRLAPAGDHPRLVEEHAEREEASKEVKSGEREPNGTRATARYPDRRAADRALTMASRPDADPLAKVLASEVVRLRKELRAANKGAETNMEVALLLISRRTKSSPESDDNGGAGRGNGGAVESEEKL
jgi:phage protein D